MTSASAMEALFALQEVEERLQVLASYEENSEETECVRRAEDVFDRCQLLLTRIERKMKAENRRLARLELDLAAVEEDVAKHQQQMFDGSATDARTLRNLEERVNTRRKKQQQLEDEALQCMEGLEQLQHQYDQVRKRREKAEAQRAKARRRWTDAKTQWDHEISDLMSRREQLGKQIPLPLMNQYQSLQGKISRPLVPIRQGTCGGCHVTLPTALQRPKSSSRCPNCSRLLWRFND